MSGKVLSVEIVILELARDEYRYKRYLGMFEKMLARSLLNAQESLILENLKSQMNEAFEMARSINQQNLQSTLAKIKEINAKLKEMILQIQESIDTKETKTQLRQELTSFINETSYKHPLDNTIKLTLYEIYNELGGDGALAQRVASFHEDNLQNASYETLRTLLSLYLEMQTKVQERLNAMEDSLAIAECFEYKLRLEGYETSRQYIDDDFLNGIKIVSNKDSEVAFELSNIVTHSVLPTYRASLKINHKECYAKTIEIQSFFLENNYDFKIENWGEPSPVQAQKLITMGERYASTSKSKA